MQDIHCYNFFILINSPGERQIRWYLSTFLFSYVMLNSQQTASQELEKRPKTVN